MALSESLRRRIRQREVPGPAFAAIALLDSAAAVPTRLADAPGQIVNALRDLPAQAGRQYSVLVQRGQDRTVEIAAQRAVRKRVARWEDSVTPRAGRAAVHVTRQRSRWQSSPRAASARTWARRTRQAAGRIEAPVIERRS